MFPRLKHKAILSPMAGVTDVAFRALCKRYGAGLTVTEFTSASAIVRASQKTDVMLKTDPEEKPVAVQLFGHSEEEVVQAALQIQDRFDIIDINCGCPAWKVVRSGAGSAMLQIEPGQLSVGTRQDNRSLLVVYAPSKQPLRTGMAPYDIAGPIAECRCVVRNGEYGAAGSDCDILDR